MDVVLSILNENLVGEQLSSIEFVQDYLQLRFDGPTLTVFYFPHILINNEVVSIENCSYRNKICSLIANLVHQVDYKDDDYLRISFANNAIISLDIDPRRNKTQPEIAMFSDLSGIIQAVW